MLRAVRAPARGLVPFVLGAVTAVVLGTGIADAATGGSLILGKANTAGATTTLTNTRGTALSLTSKPGTPPLAVSNSTKVKRLNSDQLDGVDSSQLQRRISNLSALATIGCTTHDGYRGHVVAALDHVEGEIHAGDDAVHLACHADSGVAGDSDGDGIT